MCTNILEYVTVSFDRRRASPGEICAGVVRAFQEEKPSCWNEECFIGNQPGNCEEPKV